MYNRHIENAVRELRSALEIVSSDGCLSARDTGPSVCGDRTDSPDATDRGEHTTRDRRADRIRDLELVVSLARQLRQRLSARDLQGRTCKSGAEQDYARDPQEDSSPDLQERPQSAFERRMEAARHPRQPVAHRRREKKPVKGKRTHFMAMLDEIASPAPDGERCPPMFTRGVSVNPEFVGRGLREAGLGAVGLGAALIADGVEACRAKFVERALAAQRAERREKRRGYYAAEKARRLRNAELIAGAKVPPRNPCPSPSELLAAYAARHDGEYEAFLFGRLVLDMEEHFRMKPEHGESGLIVNTSGGARKWLEENCPELARHYHTCMRFRRRAQQCEDGCPDYGERLREQTERLRSVA